jgi:hypothetical protein
LKAKQKWHKMFCHISQQQHCADDVYFYCSTYPIVDED